jgi:hypothetical protein
MLLVFAFFVFIVLTYAQQNSTVSATSGATDKPVSQTPSGTGTANDNTGTPAACAGEQSVAVKKCNDDVTTCVRQYCARYNVDTDANFFLACPLEDRCSKDELMLLTRTGAIQDKKISSGCLQRFGELTSACNCAVTWSTCRSQSACVDKELPVRNCGFESCILFHTALENSGP